MTLEEALEINRLQALAHNRLFAERQQAVLYVATLAGNMGRALGLLGDLATPEIRQLLTPPEPPKITAPEPENLMHPEPAKKS